MSALSNWVTSLPPGSSYEEWDRAFAVDTALQPVTDVGAASRATRGPLLIIPTTPQRGEDLLRLGLVRMALYPTSDFEVSQGDSFLFAYIGSERLVIFSPRVPNLEVTRDPLFQKILTDFEHGGESAVFIGAQRYEISDLILR